MSYYEKVNHIKQELGFYLESDNKEIINNSVYKSDPTAKTTYEEIRNLVAKCEGFEALFKD
jgi:hypothetical protein